MTQQYKIEKNIPLISVARFPLRDMEVGDNFFVPDRTPHSVAGSVSYAEKKTGFKYTTRSIDGGVRIWRVE